MKNIKTYIGIGVVALISMTSFNSCKKKGFAGPEVVPAKEGFALTSDFLASNSSINLGFPTARLTFSAGFNQRVSWEVVISGLASGAKRKYSGLGEQIVPDDVVWEGRANGVPFFQTDEYIKAELFILGITDTFRIDSIETVKAYSYHKKERFGVKYIVVDDFESTTNDKFKPVSLAVSTDALDSDIDFIADTNRYVNGFRSYKMQGRDNNNNGWSGGMNSENLVDFYLVVDTSQLLIDSGVKPEDLFFNMYVYGTGKANTTVEFKVYEFDHKTYSFPSSIPSVDTVVKINNISDLHFCINDGANLPRLPYDQSVNDGWIYDQEVTWTGWKLVSVPYSQFRAANDLLMGGNGDRIKESWRICGMAVSLLSYPTTGMLTETYIDYLTITQGGRFKQ